MNDSTLIAVAQDYNQRGKLEWLHHESHAYRKFPITEQETPSEKHSADMPHQTDKAHLLGWYS